MTKTNKIIRDKLWVGNANLRSLRESILKKFFFRTLELVIYLEFGICDLEFTLGGGDKIYPQREVE